MTATMTKPLDEAGLDQYFGENGHEGDYESTYEGQVTARDLRTQYLLCRRSVLGHVWDPFQDNEKAPAQFGTRFSLRCVRCMTKRHDVRSYRGELLHRQYEYPDDYKISGEVTGEDLWAEVLVRRDNGEITIKTKPTRSVRSLVGVG